PHLSEAQPPIPDIHHRCLRRFERNWARRTPHDGLGVPMIHRRAMREVSLGVLRRGIFFRTTRRWAVGAPRRGLSLMSVARGVHDGVLGVLKIVAWLSGNRPLLYSSTLSQTRPQTSSTSHQQQPHTQRFQSSSMALSFHTSPPVPPTADPDAETSLPEQLRAVMRLLANPVVVCTSTHCGVPRAMTMSSFTSLTLEPTPLVTFNVATPSRTLDAIAASRAFNIHVLAGDAAGAAVADHFTRGNVDGVFEGLATLNEEGGGAPVLGGEGVLRVLRCRVLLEDGPEGGLVRVRDHVIVVGEVVEMIPGRKTEEFGLAYADRRYRQVGDVIAKD
ncbi:Flavin reductase-like, FMN-binding protein, partial [Tolypocladium capitatum]